MLELSQVILGVRDLEAASARIRGLGLDVLDGGAHPGLGTANRVIPLGRQYLELLGVIDDEQARDNDSDARSSRPSRMAIDGSGGPCVRTRSTP